MTSRPWFYAILLLTAGWIGTAYQLQQERTAQQSQFATWEQQRVTLTGDVARQAAQIADLERQVAVLTRDKSQSLQSLNDLMTRIAQGLADNGALTAERDSLAAEKTALVAERDGLAAEKATLVTERDGLAAEKATLITERDGLAAEKTTLIAERDGLAAEKTALLAERDGLAAEKTALVAEKSTLDRQHQATQGRLTQAVTALKIESDAHAEAQRTLATITEDAAALRQAHTAEVARATALEEQQRETVAQLAAAQRRGEEQATQLATARQQAKQAEVKAARAQRDHQTQQAALEEATARVGELQSQVVDLRGLLEAASANYNRVAAQLSNALTERQTLLDQRQQFVADIDLINAERAALFEQIKQCQPSAPAP